MNKTKWLNLQLFAEGAGGEGASGNGEEGVASGENVSVAAEQRLRELGVPEAKIRKRAKMPTVNTSDVAVKSENSSNNVQEAKAQVAAVENPTEETKTDAPARMSWDEIMADPEYNKQMQATIQSRLRTAKNAEENLAKLAPLTERLARKYGLDPANMDYDALAKAVDDDDSNYEEEALKLGVTIETAREIEKLKQSAAKEKRERAAAEQNLQDMMLRNHAMKLQQQGEAMKSVFPNFNLANELKNPRFARMVSPSGGVSVEDAYYAIHREELQMAAMQTSAKKTAQMISNSIQAGSRRPDELGTSSQAPSASTFDYRNASREQKDALKRRIREAASRGEKLPVGQ